MALMIFALVRYSLFYGHLPFTSTVSNWFSFCFLEVLQWLQWFHTYLFLQMTSPLILLLYHASPVVALFSMDDFASLSRRLRRIQFQKFTSRNLAAEYAFDA